MYFWLGNRKATVDVDGTRRGSPNNRHYGGNEEAKQAVAVHMRVFGIMHKIFKSMGRLRALTDFDGKPIEHDFTRNVLVEAKYIMKPSPHEPLILDFIAYDLHGGAGQWTEELTLENGVTLTGKVAGGGRYKSSEPPKLRKYRMFDVQEKMLHLDPSHATSPKDVEIDAVVFAVLSSNPLANGSCSIGSTCPGFPFSYSSSFPDVYKGPRSTHSLRLEYRGVEIFFTRTSNYWKALVDETALQHNSVVGVRNMDRSVLRWSDLDRAVYLLEQFIGWINHCASPVFHMKGYRKGRLVYRRYALHPQATTQRDHLSWLPWFRRDDDIQDDPRIDVQSLFDLFVKRWEENEREHGVFHTALGLLSSNQKGSPLVNPPLGYLRDTFTACAILEGILAGTSNKTKSGRASQIASCLKLIGVEDKLPFLSEGDFDEVVQTHPQLWWGNKSGKVLDDMKGKLSFPLANLENWVLHLEDPRNTRMLFALPWSVRTYLLEVSIWLADLMALKAIGYSEEYQNRLTGNVELVPWARPCGTVVV